MVIIKSSNSNLISALAENYKDAVVHSTALALQAKNNADVKAFLKSESAKPVYLNEEIEMEVLEYGSISGLKFKNGDMQVAFPSRHASPEEKEERKRLLEPDPTATPTPVECGEPFLNISSGYVEVLDPDDPFLAEEAPVVGEHSKPEERPDPDHLSTTEQNPSPEIASEESDVVEPIMESDLIHFIREANPTRKVEIQGFMKIMKNNPDKKATVSKIKAVYGNGGVSHRFEDGELGFANYSGSGIELRREKERKTFTWAAVEKIIRDLIEKGEYVSEEDEKTAAAELESLKQSVENSSEKKEKSAEYAKADPEKHKTPPLKDVPETSFTVDDVRKKLEETRVKYAGMEDFEWTVDQLIELCKTDNELCQYIMQEGKTFDKAFDYLKKLVQEKEIGVSNGIAGSVSKETALPAFIEYYKMDEEAIKAQEEAERKRKEEERKAKAAAEKKTKKKASKPSAATAKKEETKPEPKPADKPVEPVNTPPESQPVAVSAVSTVSTDDAKADAVAPAKTEPVAKKVKMPAEQQVSIWDML